MCLDGEVLKGAFTWRTRIWRPGVSQVEAARRRFAPGKRTGREVHNDNDDDSSDSDNDVNV